MKSFTWLISSSILMSTFIACDQNHIVPNEEELITTLLFTLTPAGGGEEKVFSFRDLDGDGGLEPVITTDTLASETVYHGRLELLNESVTPVENITEEVAEEGEEHQFFFVTSGIGPVAYDDLDLSGFPIGLETMLITQSTGLGFVRITLRHLPEKSAPLVSEGNILNAGGETDMEVNFAFEVL